MKQLTISKIEKKKKKKKERNQKLYIILKQFCRVFF